jgi:hypothetical protein
MTAAQAIRSLGMALVLGASFAAFSAPTTPTGLRLDKNLVSGSPFRLEISRSEYRLANGQRDGGSRKDHLGAMIDRHADAKKIDPVLVHAVIRAESAYRVDAVSSKGAVGLMQVMPVTGKRFGVSDLASPENNLQAGTAYLRYLLDRFDNLPLALAAYNAGEGAVIRAGLRIPDYPETRGYVQGIMRNYRAAIMPLAGVSYQYMEGARLDDRDLSPYRLVDAVPRQAGGILK